MQKLDRNENFRVGCLEGAPLTVGYLKDYILFKLSSECDCNIYTNPNNINAHYWLLPFVN